MHYRSSSVFSLGQWAAQLPTGLACPAVLRKSVRNGSTFAYRTGTVSGRLFNTFQLVIPSPSMAPKPRPDGRFGLFRVRSPLLAELFLFLWVLRCFSSPGSLHTDYVFIGGSQASLATAQGVSPFGHPRILRLHTAPRGFSQCSTSFFGA